MKMQNPAGIQSCTEAENVPMTHLPKGVRDLNATGLCIWSGERIGDLAFVPGHHACEPCTGDLQERQHHFLLLRLPFC